MLPSILFSVKSSCCKATKLPNEGGMMPIKRFLTREISSSLDKLPISLGILPANLLDSERGSPHKDRVVDKNSF